jgi:hypothetical protein
MVHTDSKGHDVYKRPNRRAITLKKDQSEGQLRKIRQKGPTRRSITFKKEYYIANTGPKTITLKKGGQKGPARMANTFKKRPA